MVKGTPKKTGFETPVNPAEKEPWPKVRLGDVCEIHLGKTPPRGNSRYWCQECDDGCTWLSIADLSHLDNGIVFNSKEFITQEAVKENNIFLVAEGTLLLSFKLTLGRAAIAGRKLCTNEAIAALPLQDLYGNKIDKRYLVWYFTYFDWDEFASKDEKVLGKTLNKKKLAEVPVILPPLPVQRSIVARLEKELGAVDRMAKGFEKMAEEADAVFKAELKETFEEVTHGGTETRRLGDVCETTSGGTPLKQHEDYYKGGTIPWLRSGEVCKKDITQTELFITEKGLRNSSAKLVPKDSVVVAMYGATAGQVGILRIEATTNQAICVILPSETWSPEFMYYQLLNKNDEMVAQAQGGAQPNISQIKIKNLLVALPPLCDSTTLRETKSLSQHAVVARLDAAKAKCEAIKSAAQRGAAECARLRKAILKEAFE